MTAPARGAMYDAESLTWKSSGRWWSMFGGQRALLLQIANPHVAAGVVQHSEWETNPTTRLVRTLQLMLTIAFASPELSERAVAQIDKRHETVRGSALDGTTYSADDVTLKAWVWATLVDSVLESERRFVGRWSPATRASFYEESIRMARRLGVADVLPRTHAGFEAYFRSSVESLEPDDNSKAVAVQVIRPQVWRVPSRWWWPSSSIAIDMLPPDARERLNLPALMPTSVGWVVRTEERTRRLLRVLPEPLTANPFLLAVPHDG